MQILRRILAIIFVATGLMMAVGTFTFKEEEPGVTIIAAIAAIGTIAIGLVIGGYL